MTWRKKILCIGLSLFICNGLCAKNVSKKGGGNACTVNIVDPPTYDETICERFEKLQYEGLEKGENPFTVARQIAHIEGGAFYEEGSELLLGGNSGFVPDDNEISEEELEPKAD